MYTYTAIGFITILAYYAKLLRVGHLIVVASIHSGSPLHSRALSWRMSSHLQLSCAWSHMSIAELSLINWHLLSCSAIWVCGCRLEPIVAQRDTLTTSKWLARGMESLCMRGCPLASSAQIPVCTRQRAA